MLLYFASARFASGSSAAACPASPTVSRDEVVAHVQRVALIALEGRKRTSMTDGRPPGCRACDCARRSQRRRAVAVPRKARRGLGLRRSDGSAGGAAGRRTAARDRGRRRRPRGCRARSIARLDTADAELALRRAEADATRRAPRSGCCRPARARRTSARRGRRPIRQADVQRGRGRAAGCHRRSSALRGAARSRTPARASSATMRRRGAMWRRRACTRRANARAPRARRSRGCAPARAREEIDGARARVAAADAQIASLREERSPTPSLTSPIAGIVTAKLADAGEMVAPRSAARRDHRSRSRVGQRLRRRAGRAAAAARPAGDALHRRRRQRHRRARSRSSRRRPSSRRATCRPPKSARSSSTASRSSVDNRDGVLKPGMPVEAELAAVAAHDAAIALRSRRRSATATLDAPCDELSFAVERGEMFGLIGPDGAGKTTTIRLICGLLRADAGQRPRARPRSGRASIARSPTSVGYLSQRFSLYGDLSIDENIAFFAEIHGVRDYQARARSAARDDAADAVPRSRCADQLSGGMKQKLALACTLVHEPQLIAARRADDRRRSGVAPRVLEAAVGVPVARASRS